MSEAFPRAIEYYRQGFVEDWGPERHDPNGPPGYGGQVTLAARDIAQGHVIIILLLLMVLVAYLSRGRGKNFASLLSMVNPNATHAISSGASTGATVT